MELTDVDAKKTFGEDILVTHQSKWFLTMDHTPTGIHVTIAKKREYFGVCIFRGLTSTCMKVPDIPTAIEKLQKTDWVKATAWTKEDELRAVEK